MSDQLKSANVERVWFITGCSSGFGRLLAERAFGMGDRDAARRFLPGNQVGGGGTERGALPRGVELRAACAGHRAGIVRNRFRQSLVEGRAWLKRSGIAVRPSSRAVEGERRAAHLRAAA